MINVTHSQNIEIVNFGIKKVNRLIKINLKSD